MRLWRQGALAVLCAGLAAISSGLSANPSPSSAALEVLKKLPASRMGVDRAGNLWVWNQGRGSVQFLSPAGDLFGRVRVAGAMAVDADAEWGVVGSFEQDRELRWLRPDAAQKAVRFDTEISDVCWIGSHTVAVGLKMAAHRAEIWDVQSGTMLKALGSEVELHPGIGATRLRGILLRYDFARNRLIALESLTGDLQVFTLKDGLVWKGNFENPERARVEAMIRDSDRQARAAGDIQTPMFSVLFPQLDTEGVVWVVQYRDPAARSVTLAGMTREGVAKRTFRDLACTTAMFAFWGDQAVFYRDPASPQDDCPSIRRVP